MHSFEVHSNESACRKSGRLGLEQVSWECLINALMLSESLLIKTLMLTLRGLDLGVPSYSRLLKLALSSRSMPLFQYRY